MSIIHVKSNTVGDFTGTVTVYNSQGSTVTANATDLVRPSDWNSSHGIVYALSGNTAGSSAVSGLDVVLVGGNNVTLSADTAASKLVISGANTVAQTVQTQSNVQGLSAGTQVGRTGDIVFADSNGLTWGMSGSSQITASYSQSTHSHSTAPGAIAAGTQTATSGTIVYANSNGITFGMSGSSQVTASHNGLTTARASNDAVGLNTALTAGPLAWTVNSSGISLNAGSAAGTTSGFAGNLISGSMTHNTAGLNLSLNHPAWLTTAAQSVHGHTITVSATGNTTQSSSGTLNMGGFVLAGSGNASVGVSNNSLIVSVVDSPLSLFAASNTTQSSSGTVNESSIVFAGAGIASVGITNGSVVVSVPSGGGGVNPVASASNGSFSFTTLAFSNANNVTFGTSAGSIITASVAAPGAAAEQNAINLLGANTAGNTTATGSTIGLSGINLTLSGTNGSIVNISAPATSSLVGVDHLSLSSNGSTISIYEAPVCSFWPPQPLPIASSSLNSGTSGATGGSFQTTASLYVSPMQLWAPLTYGEVELVVSHGALSAGTGSGSIMHALGIYTLNGGTALSLVSSFEFNARISVNSATAVSAHFYWGTNSTSNSTSFGGNSSASITGARQIKLYDSTGSLSAGDYWVAHAYTARSSSVNVLTSFATGMFLSQSQTNLVMAYFGNNTTAPTQRHIGQVSTTLNNANSLVFAMPASINTTAITNTGGSSQHRYNLPRFYV